jgi:type II secretory pathway component PulC
MVSDRIVREGDMVNGYKVVKIHRDKVEFERNGKIFTKQVNK